MSDWLEVAVCWHVGLNREIQGHTRDFRARADDKARDLGFR